jgi:hypothetical protein
VFKAANTTQPLLPQMQSSAVVEMNPQEMKTREPGFFTWALLNDIS